MTKPLEEKKDRTLLAEIVEIHHEKITDFYANELLRFVGVPIDADYGRKLKDAGICDIAFYEQEYDYRGSPTEKIYIGEII